MLFAVHVSYCTLSKPYDCATDPDRRPEPEQRWTSPRENIVALAGEDFVGRLVRVNCKGLLCACSYVCVRTRGGAH